MLQKSDYHIIELASIESTNNYLSNLIFKTKVVNNTVILAHNQTNGRGQMGTGWMSEPNKNLTFSIYKKWDNLLLVNNFFISMAVANAVRNTLLKYVKEVAIKWPNDLFISNKKIAGILIENTLSGKDVRHSIVGVGLNINQIDFIHLTKATSLSKITGSSFDKIMVLNEFLSQLSSQFNLLETYQYDKIKHCYLSFLIGYKTNFNFTESQSNELKTGEIVSVKSNGELVVKQGLQLKNYFFKEIKFEELG